MIRLLVLILIVAGLWSGYWFVGAAGSRAGFEAWFKHQRNSGWIADYADFKLAGFPNRFDAGFTGLSLADPHSGLAWKAPFFQILALSYQPNHIIAVWPEDQVISTPHETYQLTSSDMRASLRLQANTGLALESAVITAKNLLVTPDKQSEDATGVAALTLAVEQFEDIPATYRLGLTANEVIPAAQWVALVDPNRTLPITLTTLSADLTVRFNKPWNRAAIEGARPQPRHIDIRQAEASWGRLQLTMTGNVMVDPSGLPKGDITIKARNWRDILALAVTAGAVSEALAGPLEEGLGAIATLAGHPDILDIPLSFRQEQVYLGPVSLGPAPVLTWR